MKIKTLELTNYPPIKKLRIENMGNVVVIAGANGSGKTRLKQAIMSTIIGNAIMDMTIEATRPEEEEDRYFQGKTLEIVKGVNNNILRHYIDSRKYGSGRFVGSLVQIDSSRSVQTLKYAPVSWLGGDPDDRESPGTYYFDPFTNRWQDFVNYIHQKSAARDKKIAEEIKREPHKTGQDILNSYPDPLEKYQNIFADALPGKQLQKIDPASPREFQYKDRSGQTLNFSSLSSGEQEIIKILFDVARKDIKHSVIIVDEPELHLHPTLTFQLVESLKNIGDHTNQFIFLTHSSDLISTYYATGDVYFIDSSQDGSNQAHRLIDLTNDHQSIIPLIGQNLGLFAVGKKLVFVEGEASSIDRLAYQKIAQVIDPEIRVIPVGSVLNIMTLNSIEEQIRKAIFGIDLYMIRDRDGLDHAQISDLERNRRIRCLRRRHIENYFLDEEVLFKVAKRLYLTQAMPDLTVEKLKADITRIAENSLGYNIYKNTKEHLALNYFLQPPTVKELEKKNTEEIKTELIGAVSLNLENVSAKLTAEKLKVWMEEEEKNLRNRLLTGQWIDEFRGKYIFDRLCGDVLKEDKLKIRHAYIDIALSEKQETLKDIIDIFRHM
ncbi:MAG: AAA family ATPase [Nitrospira sp.]|nr:AAA family ATPase [Nitrospira sp.]